MNGFKLLMATVPHNKGEIVTGAAIKAGSFGGTILMGRSISAKGIMAALGLGDTSVDIAYIVVQDDAASKIKEAILTACAQERSGFGTLSELNISGMAKMGILTQGETDMAKTEMEMITVILNRGYADDAMAAARKAGAGGGTVINARGTAREEDEKFFGMQIVPEKEMLMIVVAKEKKEAVLAAIKDLPCLNQPGSGVAFCSDVNEFAVLGKN